MRLQLVCLYNNNINIFGYARYSSYTFQVWWAMNNQFVENLNLNATVKKFWKSANICGSCRQGLLSPLGRWTHSPPGSVPKWGSGGVTPGKFLKIDAQFCAFWGILAQLTDSLDWPVLRQFFQVCDLFPNWSPYANLSLTLKNMKNVLKSDIAIYNYLRKIYNVKWQT